MTIKGTQTEKNLLTAFAGESQARNRYTYFASQARKEGYEQIAAIFTETSEQEKEHAKRQFKFMEGGEVEVQASFPAGIIGNTLENLKAAAAGEHYEHTMMYPNFAKIAEKEGFAEIAGVFSRLVIVESRHERRYLALAKNLSNGTVFQREKSVLWVCRNCGYIHDGKTAPEKCPLCAHSQGYFELEIVNY